MALMFVEVNYSNSGFFSVFEKKGRLSDRAELNGFNTVVASTSLLAFTSEDEKRRFLASFYS